MVIFSFTTGEYPETLIDPTLNTPLNKLHNALASFLFVNVNSIKILTIRSVYKYRSSYELPKPFKSDKNETLTDIIFYVPSYSKYEVEYIINAKLHLFQSRFQITAVASGPNPCQNYNCPTGKKHIQFLKWKISHLNLFMYLGTTCRPTRTIAPKPLTIDTNLTSFVGINILDSADCVNASYNVNLRNKPSGCQNAIFNNLTYCTSMLLLSYGPIGPCCEILGRTFDENAGGYARYAGTRFSHLAPARFSFDFIVRSKIVDSLIFLYGRTVPPIDDFFWIAIGIYDKKLRFHFRNIVHQVDQVILSPSIWYHVECQVN